MNAHWFYFGILVLVSAGFEACKTGQKSTPASVKNVMDKAVTRLYETHKPEQLDTISHSYILQFLSEPEKEVLATQYLTFDVDVPAVISLMRDQNQKVVPFWLTERGFRKTALVVKNEEYTYEVWQKAVQPGTVRLGINGFDKHRPVYFISIGPQKPGEKVTITNVFPANQTLDTMRTGAFTYHDWSDLTLTDVPESLRGQILVQTIRGRAREAHLVGAFRKTTSPSQDRPDQLLLTWSGDPATTQDVQWRVAPSVKDGVVQYWITGTKDTLSKPATAFLMEDRLLQNDRYVNRFTAQLSGLKAGKTYGYRVGSKTGNWSVPATFRTQSATADGFSFIWFGDTHKSPDWGAMARKTLDRHPEITFYSIAGDLVSTGLHRDEWDELWQHSGGIFHYKPLMPIPGNHDSQDGLGAWMYQAMFSLPKNGPAHKDVPAEQTYAFTYQNALFLMIDATSPIDAQTAWIQAQLASSKADWKFAFFHFPPYNFEEDYADIRREWCRLFDQYHVDMVMSGHVHYYQRTKPMFAEKPVASPAQGTIYTISIGIPSEHEVWPAADYAQVRYKSGPFYQHMTINGKMLTYTVYDKDGHEVDELKIVK
ncbi:MULTISPECIES: metallophosphoesterase family protein [unclassified Spirosoma]|uniref:purple acid phosphatase family protein n=1 Tax=unclassified Spirosoma TaxID=2621999 RepID=UPI000AAAA6DF|nr:MULTISPECIES: metallophosphoesterase family protein [unclassified Spirosoma]MBN8823456.1 metallophosphoesterase family protein [Spirosoma sp.]